ASGDHCARSAQVVDERRFGKLAELHVTEVFAAAHAIKAKLEGQRLEPFDQQMVRVRGLVHQYVLLWLAFRDQDLGTQYGGDQGRAFLGDLREKEAGDEIVEGPGDLRHHRELCQTPIELAAAQEGGIVL